MNKITIDDRTGSKELFKFLPDGITKLGHLEFGDASFIGTGPDGPVLIGLERKGLLDLVRSLKSGRFQAHQLPGLTAAYTYAYLIIEGYFKSRADWFEYMRRGKGWRNLGPGAKWLDPIILSLSHLVGLTVVRTMSITETAQFILHCYKWWQKDWDSHRGHFGFHRETPPKVLLRKPSLMRRLAKELPGIGWERSLQIEKHFDSVEEMFAAPLEEWEQIPGIGHGIAKQIKEVIT